MELICLQVNRDPHMEDFTDTIVTSMNVRQDQLLSPNSQVKFASLSVGAIVAMQSNWHEEQIQEQGGSTAKLAQPTKITLASLQELISNMVCIFWYNGDKHRSPIYTPRATSRPQPSAHHPDLPICSW